MRETGEAVKGTRSCAWLTTGWSVGLVLAIAVAGCKTQNSAPESAAAPPQTPQLIYARHCLGCHGAKGEGAMGANIQGLNRSVDQIVAVIANGEDKMPNFRGDLSEAQMRAVAEYVRGFKLPQR